MITRRTFDLIGFTTENISLLFLLRIWVAKQHDKCGRTAFMGAVHSMIMDIYSHVHPGLQQVAMSKLNTVFKRSEGGGGEGT